MGVANSGSSYHLRGKETKVIAEKENHRPKMTSVMITAHDTKPSFNI